MPSCCPKTATIPGAAFDQGRPLRVDVVEVVRYFNEAEREPGYQQAQVAKNEPTRTLGWHLGRDVLDFLQATGAGFDIATSTKEARDFKASLSGEHSLMWY